MTISWNEVTLWNEVTIFWNEVTVRWNEVTWNEVTMERSDRTPYSYSSLPSVHPWQREKLWGCKSHCTLHNDFAAPCLHTMASGQILVCPALSLNKFKCTRITFSTSHFRLMSSSLMSHKITKQTSPGDVSYTVDNLVFLLQVTALLAKSNVHVTTVTSHEHVTWHIPEDRVKSTM